MLQKILKQLDNQDWEKFKTSYGNSAHNVPKEIRRVLFGNEKERLDADLTLRELLYADFSLSEVAQIVAPILIELLKTSEILEQSKVVFLSLLSGFLYSYSHNAQRKKIIQKIIRDEVDLYLRFLKLDGTELQEFSASVLFSEGNFPPFEYPYLRKVYLDLKKRVPEDSLFRKDFPEYDSVWLDSDVEE